MMRSMTYFFSHDCYLQMCVLVTYRPGSLLSELKILVPAILNCRREVLCVSVRRCHLRESI